MCHIHTFYLVVCVIRIYVCLTNVSASLVLLLTHIKEFRNMCFRLVYNSLTLNFQLETLKNRPSYIKILNLV